MQLQDELVTLNEGGFGGVWDFYVDDELVEATCDDDMVFSYDRGTNHLEFGNLSNLEDSEFRIVMKLVQNGCAVMD